MMRAAAFASAVWMALSSGACKKSPSSTAPPPSASSSQASGDAPLGSGDDLPASAPLEASGHLLIPKQRMRELSAKASSNAPEWARLKQNVDENLTRPDDSRGSAENVALVYLLAGAVHYALLAMDASRRAEHRALELQVHAREAELKALRAQIDPHFLFNSLHSISALTGSDPAGARRMALLLGDFLRDSLRVGRHQRIALAEELRLLEQFLEIERVRFGDRLRAAWDIQDDSRSCQVPHRQ